MSQLLVCVYYKLPADAHAAWAPQVRTLQAALAARTPGLVCELLRRPQASDGVQTWMETYRADVEGPAQGLVDTIDAAARAAGLPQPRHTEVFVPLA